MDGHAVEILELFVISHMSIVEGRLLSVCVCVCACVCMCVCVCMFVFVVREGGGGGGGSTAFPKIVSIGGRGEGRIG